MKLKILFAVSVLGVLLACTAAVIFARQQPAEAPLFPPAANAYSHGIYAEGIIESNQTNGSNISLYPEVPGTVVKVLVNEGDPVRTAQPLLLLDDSIQRSTADQQTSQAQAAKAVLDELRALPRQENLRIALAQVTAAQASLKTASDAWIKQNAAHEVDARTVSKDALDTAANSKTLAQANLEVAKRQYELTKAGAWSFDIRNQQLQYLALSKAAAASRALLAKYTLRAPSDAVVLYINTTVGSYISPQGSYDIYTESATPVMVLGTPQARLHVRCYVDEILVSRLPPGRQLKAEMTIRGTNVKVPLRFERIQPLISPKIELSNQRRERVDVRVLPVIFSFDKPANVSLYPGELVDVYVEV